MLFGYFLKAGKQSSRRWGCACLSENIPRVLVAIVRRAHHDRFLVKKQTISLQLCVLFRLSAARTVRVYSTRVVVLAWER
jgi:hypothetical protein